MCVVKTMHMLPKILAVLPLRLESRRIPKKILEKIGGKAMCVRSLERALAAFKDMPEVHVVAAVDSGESADFLAKAMSKDLSAQVNIVMTDPNLPSGTDRVLAAADIYLGPGQLSRLQGVLNIQGDMPFMGPKALRQIARVFLENPDKILSRASILTLSEPFGREMRVLQKRVPRELVYKEAYQAYMSAAAVKVICDKAGFAIYFSRYPIPYSRVPLAKPLKRKTVKPLELEFKAEAQLHLGVYGYTPQALVEFCAQSPTQLELVEGLEQLRAMWLGQRIFVLEAEFEARTSFRGMDVPEDLIWARKSYKKFT